MKTMRSAKIIGNNPNIIVTDEKAKKNIVNIHPFLSPDVVYTFKGRKIRAIDEPRRRGNFFTGFFPIDIAKRLLRFIEYRPYLIVTDDPGTLLVASKSGKSFTQSISTTFVDICMSKGGIALNGHYVRNIIASTSFANKNSIYRDVILWHVKMKDIEQQTTNVYFESNRLLNEAMNELVLYRYKLRQENKLALPEEVLNHPDFTDWQAKYESTERAKEEQEKQMKDLIGLLSRKSGAHSDAMDAKMLQLIRENQELKEQVKSLRQEESDLLSD